jgi:hypothetical protein
VGGAGPLVQELCYVILRGLGKRALPRAQHTERSYRARLRAADRPMLMARSAAARTMSLAMLTMSAAPLKFHDVPRDGNCLFSAVALSADGATKPQSADALRAQAMDVLCSSGDVSLGGLPANLIIEPLGGEGEVGYCRRMRRSGEWGSTAELLALTRVLSRPIRVHTAFGAELYGADEGTAWPLAVHYENSHYRAVTEAPASESAPPASSTCAAARLDAGEEAAVAAVAAVLDTLHAAASRADARTYFGCFEEDAVFMGTDPHERWSLAQFRACACCPRPRGTARARTRDSVVCADVGHRSRRTRYYRRDSPL